MLYVAGRNQYESIYMLYRAWGPALHSPGAPTAARNSFLPHTNAKYGKLHVYEFLWTGICISYISYVSDLRPPMPLIALGSLNDFHGDIDSVSLQA